MSRTALRIVLTEVVAACLALTGIGLADAVVRVQPEHRPSVAEAEVVGTASATTGEGR